MGGNSRTIRETREIEIVIFHYLGVEISGEYLSIHILARYYHQLVLIFIDVMSLTEKITYAGNQDGNYICRLI